jgi:photosystem II stability/assembly factor-like uncharacterized protein
MIDIQGVFKLKTALLSIILLYFCFSTVFAVNHEWDRTNPGGGGTMGMVGATKDGTIIAVSDLSGIYRQTKDKKRWEPLGGNNGLPGATALGFDPDNASIFYVGTEIGLYRTKNGTAIKSQDVKFEKLDPVVGSDDVYVESVVVAKNDSKTIYTALHPWGTGPSAIYRSLDGGGSWSKVGDLPGKDSTGKSWNIMKLLIHPVNKEIIYALTGASYHTNSEARLFRSQNGGVDWTRIATNLPKGLTEPAQIDILDMDVHPIEENTVFVSTYKANGQNVESENNLGAFYKIEFKMNGGSDAIALTDKSGVISVDSGSQPTIRLVDIFTSNSWDDNRGDIKWERQSGAWKSLYPWTDWHQMSEVNDWDTGNRLKHYFVYSKTPFGFSKQLTKDLFHPERIYAAFGQVSLDGGKTFKNIHSKPVKEETPRMKSSWLSMGIENTNGHALDINDTNPMKVYMGGYDIGFWRSQDSGRSWKRSQPDVSLHEEYLGYTWWGKGSKATSENGGIGDGSNISFILSDPARENIIWASFGRAQSKSDMLNNADAKRGLFKSSDAGKTWALMSGGDLPKGSDTFMMYGLSMDINSDVNSRTLYMTVNGDVYKSTDDGSNWAKQNLPAEASEGLKFTEVDKFNSSLVYAGGAAGLFRSKDGGISWGFVDPGKVGGSSGMRDAPSKGKDIVPTYGDSGWAWQGVFDLKADPHVPNRVYVTAYGKGKGLWRSDNAGDSWTKLLDDNYMRGVAIAPQNSNLIYATSSDNYHSGGNNKSSGIQYSLDAGKTWQPANDGMAWNYGGLIRVTTENAPKVWTWSPGTGVQYSDLPIQIKVCDIISSKLKIPPNQWHQISLPCAPPTTAQTVKAIFADDISGSYGKEGDWVVFSYDRSKNEYNTLKLDSTLAQGVGYWIIYSKGSATIDMPDGSSQTTPVEACKSAANKKCFRIPLVTKAGNVQWNMSGQPFLSSIPLTDLRIVTKKDSVCANGCTLNEAKSNRITENRLWSYNGSSKNYEVIQGNTPLNTWKGAWVAALGGGEGLEPTLEIPVE